MTASAIGVGVKNFAISARFIERKQGYNVLCGGFYPDSLEIGGPVEDAKPVARQMANSGSRFNAHDAQTFEFVKDPAADDVADLDVEVMHVPKRRIGNIAGCAENLDADAAARPLTEPDVPYLHPRNTGRRIKGAFRQFAEHVRVRERHIVAWRRQRQIGHD